MDELFRIHTVADLLNISPSTLRFWEKKGLFTPQKQPNQYRGYTYQNLAQIAHVIFLRNLGVPIAKVDACHTYSLEEYTHYIMQISQHIREKIDSYQGMLLQIDGQMESLREAQRLYHTEPQPETIPFEAVEPFEFFEKEKLIRYIQRPSCYVRYFDTQQMESETRCIIVSSEDSSVQPLWRRDDNCLTLSFLIRERVNHNYQSDVGETLAMIQKSYHTGHLLAQYLVTAEEEGEPIDYLKGYVEVRQKNSQTSF